MAVGADGSLFVTNSFAPQILRLKPGASQLEVWLDDPAFEQPPKGAPGLDGIAFGKDGHLYVDNFANGAFFRVEVKDGAPGKITKMTPSRPLKNPDALRSTGGALEGWPCRLPKHRGLSACRIYPASPTVPRQPFEA